MKFIKMMLSPISAIASVLRPSVRTQAVDTKWSSLTREVGTLHRTGQYDRAVVFAHKALEIAIQNGGTDHRDVATSLNNLAGLYNDQGDYAKAEPFYKRSLAILGKALGPNHPNVAITLDNMAVTYRNMERDVEAAVLEERAARTRAIKRSTI